jgi:hypothetical protein
VNRRLIAVLAALAVAIGVTFGYVTAGPLGGYLVASVVFVVATALLLATMPAVAKAPKRNRAHAERPPATREFGDIGRIEMEVLDGLRTGRIYDHALRPRLYRLQRALLQQRKTGAASGPAAVRAHVGEQLWPMIDPSVRSFDDTPKVTARELDELLARLEESR